MGVGEEGKINCLRSAGGGRKKAGLSTRSHLFVYYTHARFSTRFLSTRHSFSPNIFYCPSRRISTICTFGPCFIVA